jgi:hypothetical protein
MLTADFSLAHFIDNTGSSTTTMVSGVDEWQPDFGTRDRWFVVLEGPRFFKKTAASRISDMVSAICGSGLHSIEFPESFPEAPVHGNLLYMKFSGKALWLPVFAKSNDHVEWAFSSEGSVDWICDMDVPMASGSSGPVLCLQGNIDNRSRGIGLFTYKAYQGRRVSVLLQRITDHIKETWGQ